MTLSEYLIEAVAKRKAGKYKELTMDDLTPGMRVKIKDSLDKCNIEGHTTRSHNTGDPIVGSIVITQVMQWWLGKTVTVERISTPKGFKPAVYVEENEWAWPVEIFELP